MTTDEVYATIDHFLAIPPYYPCLLLVHDEIRRLQTISQQIIERYGWANLSVGALFSAALLPLAPNNRPKLARRTFVNLVKPHQPGPLLCTDIDLLFEPSLLLNPLRLLREASRQVTLVVLWPGKFVDGILSYAVNTHRHYQMWTQTDLCNYCIVAL